jgi:hypothetical protein
MTQIDIKLPDSIAKQLQIPRCLDISIPKPKVPEIRLPTGGSIKGIADLTKGIPSDCSLNFSLAGQLAPIMASIECLVKVLALISPLIDVVKGLAPPDPLKLAEAVPKFLEAAKELAPCLLVPTPAAMLPFVADILRLIIAMLRCLVQQLRSIMALIGGLELKIATARASGNEDLLATLKCARANADSSLASTMMGLEPIGILVELAGPFLSIAGVDPIELPAAAGAEDMEQLNETLTTLEEFLATLQLIADALP